MALGRQKPVIGTIVSLLFFSGNIQLTWAAFSPPSQISIQVSTPLGLHDRASASILQRNYGGNCQRKCQKTNPSFSSTTIGVAQNLDDNGKEIINQNQEITTTPVNLEDNLQTLSRIFLPSTILALISYASFPTIAENLAIAIHDSFDGTSTTFGTGALELILTDNSNQFIQNVHNFCSLLFSLLTGYTFSFLYKQQESVYYALFEEVGAAESLLEQLALVSEGRVEMYKTLLESVRRYVREDLRIVMADPNTALSLLSSSISLSPVISKNEDDDNQINNNLRFENDDHLIMNWKDTNVSKEDIPALLLSMRPYDDPLETILYVTSVGQPSQIYQTVRTLRQARAKRLGALQRKMPELNLYLLYILGSMAWMTFPVVAAGAQTVGGTALLDVERVHLGVGVFAMGMVFGVINELKRPNPRSVYTVDYDALYKLVDGLESELNNRLAKCVRDISKNLDDSSPSSFESVQTMISSEDKRINNNDFDQLALTKDGDGLKKRPNILRRLAKRVRKRIRRRKDSNEAS